MKKKLIIIPAVLVAFLVGCVYATHFIIVRALSKKHNLIVLDEENLPEKQEIVEDDFVQLSEIKMHYVKYGIKEQAVILIHGNRGTVNSLKELAQYLANDYTVYCIESRCHGESTDTELLSYDLMAKDVHEFIVEKGINNPYLVGHSDGGIIGLILSHNYPQDLKALVSCGANSKPEGLKNDYLNKCKRNKKNKFFKLMLDEPHLSKSFLGEIKTPTYVVAGEYDVIRLSDTVFMHESIPDSKIAIIKNKGHSNYMSSNGKLAYHLVTEYFQELK